MGGIARNHRCCVSRAFAITGQQLNKCIVQATAAALPANQAKAANDIIKLNKILFAHEEVQLPEALELVKKPRVGDGVFLYKRQRYSDEDPSSVAKRARTSPATEASGR